MKIKKIDTSLERKILTAMIVDDQFLSQVIDIAESEFFEISFSKHVLNWCRDYFKNYGKAPGSDIQDIFEKEKRENLDGEQAELIEEFLSRLSQDHERGGMINSDYLLDQAVRHFNKKKLDILCQDVRVHVLNGDVEEANNAVVHFSPVQRGQEDGILLFQNDSDVQKAFENTTKPLFKLPGAFGKMINGDLTRESFVAFMAPEKRGKSFLLMELALRAVKSKCHVAFFQAGDMSQDRMMRRICICLAKRSDKARYCGTVLTPILDCAKNQDDSCDMRERASDMGIVEIIKKGKKEIKNILSYDEATEEGYVPCVYCRKKLPNNYRGAVWYQEEEVKKLTWEEAVKIGKEFAEKTNRKFLLSTHANDTLSVRKMKSLLDKWEKEQGFVPDVIIVDYADIMAPEDSKLETRHQINQTWKSLRSLASQRRCLVITATQADGKGGAYESDTLTLANYSEDKRKYAHVTAMYALNQSIQEKEKGILRVGQLVVRDDESSMVRQVALLQCLQRGMAYVASYPVYVPMLKSNQHRKR